MADKYEDWVKSLSDEEKELHNDSLDLWDMEFESEIADYMGPYGRKAIDADAANIRYNKKRADLKWYLQGAYIPEDYYLDKGYYDYIKWKTGEPTEAGEVFTVGTDNATKRIWSHEFTHKDVRESRGNIQKDFLRDIRPSHQNPEEKVNLLWDAYRADNPGVWDETVGAWRSDLRGWEKKKLTKDEAEMDLRRTLNEHKEDFVDQEALTQWEGVPMNLEDRRRFYRKGFEKRVKTWNEGD